MSQFPPSSGQAPPSASPPPRVTPISAWVGLTLGLLSLCTGVTALFGLVFSIFAMRTIKRDPARFSGSGPAVIGLVTSILGFVTLFAMAGIFALGLAATNKFNEIAASIRAFQLKSAVDQYAVMNDGSFPQPSDYRVLIRDHVIGNALTDDPPLAMNNAFEPLNRHATADDKTVLFFETTPDGPISGDAESVTSKPHSSAGALIVYLNGASERVAPAKVATLKWQPTKGVWNDPSAHVNFNSAGMQIQEDESDNANAVADAEIKDADDFVKGKNHYAKNKFALAAETLHKFVDENAKDPRVGEARFFIAKSYESDPNGDNDVAIRAWQTYLEKHAAENASRTDTARKHLRLLTGE